MTKIYFYTYERIRKRLSCEDIQNIKYDVPTVIVLIQYTGSNVIKKEKQVLKSKYGYLIGEQKLLLKKYGIDLKDVMYSFSVLPNELYPKINEIKGCLKKDIKVVEFVRSRPYKRIRRIAKRHRRDIECYRYEIDEDFKLFCMEFYDETVDYLKKSSDVVDKKIIDFLKEMDQEDNFDGEVEDLFVMVKNRKV